MYKLLFSLIVFHALLGSPSVAADDVMINEEKVVLSGLVGEKYVSRLAGLTRTQQYAEIELPYAPVIHPYQPTDFERTDFGYMAVLFAGKMNACYYEDCAKLFAPCFEEPKQTFFDMKKFSYDLHYFVTVQTNPWTEDATLLFRPHYWYFGGDNVPYYSYDKLNIDRGIEAQIFSTTGIAFVDAPNSGKLLKGGISVHGANEDHTGIVISSHDNFHLTKIDPNLSHVFYSFCHGIDDNRDAITMHVMLNDDDSLEFVKQMDGKQKLQDVFQVFKDMKLTQ